MHLAINTPHLVLEATPVASARDLVTAYMGLTITNPHTARTYRLINEWIRDAATAACMWRGLDDSSLDDYRWHRISDGFDEAYAAIQRHRREIGLWTPVDLALAWESLMAVQFAIGIQTLDRAAGRAEAVSAAAPAPTDTLPREQQPSGSPAVSARHEAIRQLLAIHYELDDDSEAALGKAHRAWHAADIDGRRAAIASMIEHLGHLESERWDAGDPEFVCLA